MTKDEQRAAFLECLYDDPYDQATRNAFSDWLEENGFDDEATLHREWTAQLQQEAEEFLKEYAVEFDHTYHELLKVAHDYLTTGQAGHLNFDTPDRHYVHHDRKEFWKSFGVVTNQITPEDIDQHSFFHCGC